MISCPSYILESVYETRGVPLSYPISNHLLLNGGSIFTPLQITSYNVKKQVGNQGKEFLKEEARHAG